MKNIGYKMIQKVGDRDNPSLSLKDIAFTISANPMSDRLQKVIEIYNERENAKRRYTNIFI